MPSPNPFSNVLLFAYGRFKYYTGGDIPDVPAYNQPWWRDVETPVSAVVGPVDVIALDHHGNRDTVNANILRNLAPRVLVQLNWLSPQPGEEVVNRMASQGLYLASVAGRARGHEGEAFRPMSAQPVLARKWWQRRERRRIIKSGALQPARPSESDSGSSRAGPSVGQ